MILTKSDREGININDIINERAAADTLDTLLIVVPTNRRAHQLKIELLAGVTSPAIHPMGIYTITTLTLAILEAIGNNAALVSEPVSVLFIKQCLNELTELRYFARYKEYIPEGLLLILKKMFSEWKRQLLTPADVRAQVNPAAGEHELLKAEEIISVYELYCLKLEASGKMEIGDAYREVLKDRNSFIKVLSAMFPLVDTILVTGYSEFSSPEIEILDYCADIPGKDIFIDLDYNEYNLALFGKLNECVAQFRKKNFIAAPDSEKAEQREFITTVKDNLFLYRPGLRKDNRFCDYLTLYTAADIENEVIYMAKKIRELVITKKVNPSRICIAVHLVQNYSSLFREIFPQYDVPFDLTDRPFLSSSVFVNAVLNYLEMERSDYYFKSVFRAFSNSYIPLQFCTSSEIMEVAAEYRIIGGVREWLSAPDREPYDEEDALPEAVIEKAKNCAREIERVHAELNVFNALLLPGEFYNRFEKLVLNLGVHRNLKESGVLQQVETTTAMKALLEAVAEICAVLAMENGPAKKFNFDFYLRQITAALANTRYALPGKPYDTVLITTPEEIRGLSFDHLFIAGMYDGNFPSRYSPDIFSPEALSHTEKQYIADQQYLFYQVLSAGKSLHFSVPRTEDGKSLSSSHFLTSFLRIFNISVEDPAHFESIISARQQAYSEMKIGRDGVFECNDETAPELIDQDMLQKSVSTDRSRLMRADEAAIYNGVLQHDLLEPQALQALEGLKNKEYSISQLETYAGCPFRYFLQRVMNISVPEEPEEEASRMEFGSLLHKILFEFMMQLKAKGIGIYKAPENVKEEIRTLLFAIAEDLVAGTATGKALTDWDRELLLGIDGRRQASILSRFIEYEWENNPYEPFLFETAFGSLSEQARAGSGYAHPEPVEIEGVKLRGKIDRIDINRAQNTFNIVDYKTGANKYSRPDVERGLLLQLPVYLHVAAAILAGHADEIPQSSPLYPFIFSLKYRQDSFGLHTILSKGKRFLDPDDVSGLKEITESLIQASIAAIGAYVRGISTGKFNHTQLEKKSWIEKYACGRCEYKDLCRFQEFTSNPSDPPAVDQNPEE